jgi:hypothetical protein
MRAALKSGAFGSLPLAAASAAIAQAPRYSFESRWDSLFLDSDRATARRRLKAMGHPTS